MQKEYPPLYDAIAQNNLPTIRTLLSQLNTNVNECAVWSKEESQYLVSPLYSAVKQGNLEVVKLLLAKNADIFLGYEHKQKVYSYGPYGEFCSVAKEIISPFKRAIKDGHVEIAQL